ncbi:MAG: type IV pilus secretin PilQ [Uliginosibacterium sp.]|nr:type IV pilus secretin PilQ [Uliginosibacterium sp.]
MTIMSRVVAPLFIAVCGLCSASAAESLATSSTAVASAKNAIESVQSSSANGNVVVRILLKQPLEGQIGSFSVSNPARVAIDIPGTTNALGKNAQSINEGDVRSANIVQVADRTRLVINLLRPLSYETKVDGREISIVFSPATAKSAEATTTARFAEQKGGPDSHAIRDIGFRRGKEGEARVVVDMSDSNTGIDIRQQGQNLIVEFLKTSLPDNLRKSLDVTDFGTPVSSVVTTQQGNMVRMVVTPNGLWEHNAYQTDTQFVVEVKAIQEDPRKLVQGAGRTVKYAGEKLSLNFQNIDVRSVLQVISDFTNFNIITSDSVAGSLTLRLKDVPWDQALEIILQAKGLDMRKNGNVIWIAPKDELAAREKSDLESKTQIGDLEPLRTEMFQINYHSAKNIFEGVLKDKEKSIISKRGSVIMDERSNKLIITDVAARLEDVRRMITEIDIPVRQVLIEAQIVEANDNFAKSIGVRLGIGGIFNRTRGIDSSGRIIPQTSIGGNLAATGYYSGLIPDRPDYTVAQNTSFAATRPEGAAANPSALSFVLWNKAATRFLDMEVTALETDGRGKVVSRPRVMTADQSEALIEQGTELAFLSATSSGATAVTWKKAMLSLRVKPQITPDGRVYLSVDVNKDQPNYERQNSMGVPIDTKHVKTSVLVENGGTVVIGGIFQQDSTNSTEKTPLLGDIPVLGNLFKQTSKLDKKTELLVFITPRIVTEQSLVR